jgi:hypothetical protein
MSLAFVSISTVASRAACEKPFTAPNAIKAQRAIEQNDLLIVYLLAGPVAISSDVSSLLGSGSRKRAESA